LLKKIIKYKIYQNIIQIIQKHKNIKNN
jgi:hypothetical protein